MDMMKLEDMLGLDSSGFKVVRVRVPLSIISFKTRFSHFEGFEPS